MHVVPQHHENDSLSGLLFICCRFPHVLHVFLPVVCPICFFFSPKGNLGIEYIEQIECGSVLYVLLSQQHASSEWSKCCGLTRRSHNINVKEQ